MTAWTSLTVDADRPVPLRPLATPGTIVAHLQGSNTLASAYTSLGSTTFNDAAGGTTIQTVGVDPSSAVYRFYRSLTTVVGGTVTGGVASSFVGRPFTT